MTESPERYTVWVEFPRVRFENGTEAGKEGPLKFRVDMTADELAQAIALGIVQLQYLDQRAAQAFADQPKKIG